MLSLDHMRKPDFSGLPTFSAITDYVDQMVDSTEFASEEALNGNVFGRAFVAIADTFVGLLNTFKTNILKCTTRLKRSEIREFTESNRLKTNTVYSLTYAQMAEVQLDVPANMVGSYMDAVDKVSKLYVKLNAVATAKTALGAFNRILSALTGDGNNVRPEITDVNTVLNGIVAASKIAVNECQAQFNGKFVAKKQFKDVFVDVKEFKAVTDELLSLESRLQDVAVLAGLVGQIETVLNSIAKQLDADGGKTVIDRTSLFNLGNTAKGLALIFDSYGLAATRQMALEHNHCLNINTLFAKVN